MPMTLRPGMVATRADSADMLRAMSSASWITRLALMPLAGSSSYIVTTGPGRTSTMSPRTWKSSSTDSSSRALRSSPARSIGVRPFSGGGASRSTSAARNCRQAPGSAALAGLRIGGAADGAIGLAGSVTDTLGRDLGGAAAAGLVPRGLGPARRGCLDPRACG